MKQAGLLCCLFFGFTYFLQAQERVSTGGFQFKTMIPLNLLDRDKQTFGDSGNVFSLRQASGRGFGMVIRKGFAKGISFESGLHLTSRKYKVNFSNQVVEDNLEFSMTAYEIPFSLLVYTQLGKKVFMNGSLGSGLEMFASDLTAEGDYFSVNAFRRSVGILFLLANLGWEYRTKKSGYFYAGISYHRPYRYIYRAFPRYQNGEYESRIYGTYFSLDVRYFFHEDPVKKEKRKKRKDPKPMRDDF